MLNEQEILAQNTFPAEEAKQEAPKEQSQPDPAAQARWNAQKEASISTLRERMENAERRALELERMIQANMSQNQPSTKMQVVDDQDDIDLGDDSIVEGKQLKKYFKALKQENRNIKKQLEDNQRENALASAEIRLKSKYPDFDAVVTRDNLKKLEDAKPELFRTIYANTNLHDRGIAAYEMIRSSGLNIDEFQSLDKKMEDNKNKPRSAANASPQTSETPLTRVGDYDRRILTKERKEQILKQMEYAKSLK